MNIWSENCLDVDWLDFWIQSKTSNGWSKWIVDWENQYGEFDKPRLIHNKDWKDAHTRDKKIKKIINLYCKFFIPVGKNTELSENRCESWWIMNLPIQAKRTRGRLVLTTQAMKITSRVGIRSRIFRKKFELFVIDSKKCSNWIEFNNNIRKIAFIRRFMLIG